MLAGDEPDDFADLAFGIMAGQPGKGVRANLFVLCQLRHIVQGCSFRIGEERAGTVLLQRVEFGFTLQLLDSERPSNIHAKKADVDARHLFTDQERSLSGKQEPFVELPDLPVKKPNAGGNRALCTFNGVSTLPNSRRVK